MRDVRRQPPRPRVPGPATLRRKKKTGRDILIHGSAADGRSISRASPISNCRAALSLTGNTATVRQQSAKKPTRLRRGASAVAILVKGESTETFSASTPGAKPPTRNYPFKALVKRAVEASSSEARRQFCGVSIKSQAAFTKTHRSACSRVRLQTESRAPQSDWRRALLFGAKTMAPRIESRGSLRCARPAQCSNRKVKDCWFLFVAIECG
ncbi:hypothetical protein Mal64_15400 [Pseudobythopirellula maris]|uniref:Uncharacterized protein n=1 Tax=Pseudobythopirellula maris TaxID=2527991 RepID=A0A5C5ZVY7_9BACT|nr:hypothetical protein Mal64_15400 [Pseudobythopirellula maris]